MSGRKLAAATIALLGMVALGGCGTQTAANAVDGTNAVPADQPSAADTPTVPAVDEGALEDKIAKLIAGSKRAHVTFLAAGRDKARDKSTIAGKRLADVMAGQGLDPLPGDADVWLAKVSTPTLGKLVNPNSRDGKIAKPLFDNEVVWVMYYPHVNQGPVGVGGAMMDDTTPPSPIASPTDWYSDMVFFVKPNGFFNAFTVGPPESE